jgi:hypothetical protein
LRDAFDLKYCQESLYRKLRADAEEVRKLLNGYIAWLKTQKTGEKEPGADISVREIPAEYLIDNMTEHYTRIPRYSFLVTYFS